MTLSLGMLAAGLFVWLDTPLPWMMGPLLVISGLRMMGAPLWVPTLLRKSAHIIIGIALGLYFTPMVVAQMLSLWLPVLLGMGFALLLGFSFAAVLRRAGLDPVTAYFSGGIGGATELSVQGEHYGGNVPVIIAVHTVRVMIIVIVLPFAFRALGLQGSDMFSPARIDVFWPGLILLIMVCTAAAWPLHRFGLPNPWMIGPLLVAGAVTMAGLAPSALPEWAVRVGQLAIGITLGCRFAPETIAQVRRILMTLVLITLAGLALTACFGTFLAWLTGLPISTMVLATSPGGIAEMSLTARVLQLGVPVVTVFHVTRLVFMLLTYGPLYSVLARRYGWPLRPVKAA